MSQNYFAKHILLADGWHENIVMTIEDGFITTMGTQDKPRQDDIIFSGHVAPGMANLHSHAFQRAMAGLTEVASNTEDSFWTWRNVMYQVVGFLSPEELHVIGVVLYIEMLKAGYTSVAEFHYVHHDVEGHPYKNLAEMSLQLVESAKLVGIGQTLLPVLYSYSNFGGKAPLEGQRRFINDVDNYLAIQEILDEATHSSATQSVGLCFHSLRATTIEQIRQVLSVASLKKPVHIHISEQPKEVEDSIAYSAKRPVEYLLENISVDSRWCLVHATQINQKEIDLIEKSHSVVGLCPTTEANLGDGLFPNVDFIANSGRWGIGSDSHISVNVAEELRWLEYGQRLKNKRRNLIHENVGEISADVLYQKALAGGQQALGQPIGGISVGKRADFLVLDENDVYLAQSGKYTLNYWLFSLNYPVIKDVMVAGRWVIKDYHHELEEVYQAKFQKILRKLINKLL